MSLCSASNQFHTLCKDFTFWKVPLGVLPGAWHRGILAHLQRAELLLTVGDNKKENKRK